MYVQPAPTLEELFNQVRGERLGHLLRTLNERPLPGPTEYLHWDKVRHLDPPADLTHEEWWLGIKLGRNQLLRPFPLGDPKGQLFVYAMTDEVLRLLHYIDQHCGGEIGMPEVVIADEQARRHYLVNSLMEEAIRSSQLEGATTSRRAAKELLQSGRPPKDRSERMILNNYRALQFMRESMGDTLTPALVLELQRLLTEGTLRDPGAAGRLQRPGGERVGVYDRFEGSLLHLPPPAEQLPERLDRLCDFANAADDPERFMHPVIRAILLHFWLAYDHPFEDGNGRTARALFYWAMRTQGYWLAEYLSISRILRDAPSQYSRAFMLTETDERDTTYFVLYQLGVIKRAVEELHKYLQRKAKEVRDVERMMKGNTELNHRQLALLSDAVRNPEHAYAFSTHARHHGVTHETARTDLTSLQKKGLLVRRRVSRRYVFTPVPHLPDVLKTVS